MVARLPTRRHHWRRVGSRAAAGNARNGRICPAFSFSSLPCQKWGTPLPAKHKKTQATVCFASLQIRFLLLQVAGRWTMELLVCGCWLKETARWLAAVWPCRAGVDGDRSVRWPGGKWGGRLRETKLWVAAAAAAATARGRSWRQHRCDKETLLLLKKKKIKFFRVRIFLLFFVVKNAPLLNWNWRLFIGKIVFRASKLVPQVLCMTPNVNQFTW